MFCENRQALVNPNAWNAKIGTDRASTLLGVIGNKKNITMVNKNKFLIMKAENYLNPKNVFANVLIYF